MFQRFYDLYNRNKLFAFGIIFLASLAVLFFFYKQVDTQNKISEKNNNDIITDYQTYLNEKNDDFIKDFQAKLNEKNDDLIKDFQAKLNEKNDDLIKDFQAKLNEKNDDLIKDFQANLNEKNDNLIKDFQANLNEKNDVLIKDLRKNLTERKVGINLEEDCKKKNDFSLCDKLKEKNKVNISILLGNILLFVSSATLATITLYILKSKDTSIRNKIIRPVFKYYVLPISFFIFITTCGLLLGNDLTWTSMSKTEINYVKYTLLINLIGSFAIGILLDEFLPSIKPGSLVSTIKKMENDITLIEPLMKTAFGAPHTSQFNEKIAASNKVIKFLKKHTNYLNEVIESNPLVNVEDSIKNKQEEIYQIIDNVKKFKKLLSESISEYEKIELIQLRDQLKTKTVKGVLEKNLLYIKKINDLLEKSEKL